jgi:hypothetical protein
MISFGKPEFVPIALVGVNFFSLLLTSLLLLRLCRHFQVSEWHALYPVLTAGVLMSI